MMAQTTLARPYARAAFKVARESDAIERWSDSLALAAAVAATDEMHYLAGDPRMDRGRLLELVCEIGKDTFDEFFVNFLRLMISNDRLPLLPEVASQYEALRREADGRVRVQVTTARALDDEQSQELVKRLKTRLGSEVDLEVEVDESLIGGAVIRAGDQVIDGSVQSRLKQLGRQISI